MGTYFNPTNESFVGCTNSPFYVDKTGLLELLNARICTPSKCIALSHARRFGKTQAADMIDAYYSKGCDSRELFSQFSIAKTPDFKKYLNKYNVIHLDIAEMYNTYHNDVLYGIHDTLFEEFLEVYPELDSESILSKAIMKIYSRSSAPFVIIIDEWDCMVRNQADRPDFVLQYLQFLQSLFNSGESKEYLALGYMTGIMPIKKIAGKSALDNFQEYTMLSSRELTPYYGFTEDEVRGLCSRFGMDFDSVKAWYHGYLISGMHMYNPDSLSKLCRRRELSAFWMNTASYMTLTDFMTMDFAGLKEDILEVAGGGSVGVDVTGFSNDLHVIQSKDDALTALVHLGYLAYDEAARSVYLPNYEVAVAHQAALTRSGWTEVVTSMDRCWHSLLNATINMDAEKAAGLLQQAHDAYSPEPQYDAELSLARTVSMAYFEERACYSIVRELPAGKGFADFAFIPRREAGTRPAMIVELKWDQSADTVIRQVKEGRYAGALSGYGRDILLVDINYDKESPNKKHSCIIETFREK